ncbi:MAG: ABC transporter ATP-binding protein [Lachnospiraceae bacterium]|nr:ABC transporter ATP-binding protein [Lachnospiraceae bacterium]
MFRIVKRLINWAGNYKKRMYLGFLFSFLHAMFTAFPIVLAAYALGLILDDFNRVSSLSPQYIIAVFIAMIVAVLGRFLFSYLRATTQESIGYEMTCTERIELGNIMKRVPLGFFSQNNAGELSSAVTTDLSFMEMYAMKMVDTVVNGYISAVVMVLCLAYYCMPAAIVALVGIILSALFLYLLERKSKNNATAHQKAQDDMVESSIEYLRGMQVVKAFKQEGATVKGIHNAYEDSKKINIKIEKEYMPFNCLHLFSLKLASVGIVIVAAMLTITGTLTLPFMLMLDIFSFVIFNSIEVVNNAAHVLEIIDATLDKLERIKNTPFIDENGKDIAMDNYDIQFEDVSFAYDDKPILKNVSFNIPQNTTTAIVGPSGSGKTTICNLIARFYDTQSGTIKVGGINIKQLSCDSLLSNISMVFQKVYLFNDTIANNIRFGKPDATMEEIKQVAKKACCHDFIMSLPDQYETMIGEGGSTLSGGEKQRISIARAMLKNAPIIILDEATASIDPENEHLIQQAISALVNGKTIITIAHRLATIENANQILVVDNGHIVQRGTHKELVNSEGIYKHFIEIREQAESWSIA